ncbi:MAG: inositol monophosphatase [Patescibacteria group bacterium]
MKDMRRTIEDALYDATESIASVENLDVRLKNREVGNLVSEADLASGRAIRIAFAREITGHDCAFISEEIKAGIEVTHKNFSAHEWVVVVDEIDGTMNFVNGKPTWSISIGLHSYGEPIASGIFAPQLGLHGLLYYAERGHGVFLNNEKLTRRPLPQTPKRVVAMDWAFGKSPQELLPLYAKLVNRYTLRIEGHVALPLAWTAAGINHAYCHNSVQPHDCGAALLMLQEMGLKVTNWQGEQYTIFDKHILAAPEEFHEELFELFFGDER